jgi:hypothetical protein
VVLPRERIRKDLYEFRIARHPIELFLGYRHAMGRFALDGELSAVFDIADREALFSGSDLVSSPDRSELVFGLTPRARIAYAPVAQFALFVGMGVSFFINNFKYVGDIPKRRVLLDPQSTRLDIETGLAMRL